MQYNHVTKCNTLSLATSNETASAIKIHVVNTYN